MKLNDFAFASTGEIPKTIAVRDLLGRDLLVVS